MIKKWILLAITLFITLLSKNISAEAINTDATLGLTVTNVVLDNQSSTEPFIFQIEGKDNAPMPDVSRITINGSGKVSFTPITYHNVGTYYYTVSRVNNNLQDYSDDTSIYTVQVSVTYSLDGPNQLIATAFAYKGNKDVKEDLIFQTTYMGKSAQSSSTTSSNSTLTTSSSKKDLRGLLPSTGQSKSFLTIIGFIFVIFAVTIVIAYKYLRK